MSNENLLKEIESLSGDPKAILNWYYTKQKNLLNDVSNYKDMVFEYCESLIEEIDQNQKYLNNG